MSTTQIIIVLLLFILNLCAFACVEIIEKKIKLTTYQKIGVYVFPLVVFLTDLSLVLFSIYGVKLQIEPLLVKSIKEITYGFLIFSSIATFVMDGMSGDGKGLKGSYYVISIFLVLAAIIYFST